MDSPLAAGVLSAVEGFTHPSDADRELNELRVRAYGPDHDIDGDPRALARLRELEAAHLADVERREDAAASESSAAETVKAAVPAVALNEAQGSPEPGRAIAPLSQPVKESSLRPLLRRAMRTWWGRLARVAGMLVVAAAIVVAAFLISAPRPDATLRLTAVEADDQVRTLVTSAERAGRYGMDPSTLRAYGSYHGFNVWSGVNAFGSPCLVAVHRAFDYLSRARCAPFPADLIVDVSSSGDGLDIPAGDGIIRFIRRGDTVDAYVYLLPEAD